MYSQRTMIHRRVRASEKTSALLLKLPRYVASSAFARPLSDTALSRPRRTLQPPPAFVPTRADPRADHRCGNAKSRSSPAGSLGHGLVRCARQYLRGCRARFSGRRGLRCAALLCFDAPPLTCPLQASAARSRPNRRAAYWQRQRRANLCHARNQRG